MGIPLNSFNERTRRLIEATDKKPITKADQTRRRLSDIPKEHKFHARKSEGWDSEGERLRYEYLSILQAAGEIANLRRQVTVPLHVGKRYMRIDFVYEQDGRTVYEDFKGLIMPDWAVKRDIWAAGFGPGLLRIVKRRGGEWETTDITPKPNAEVLRRVLATIDNPQGQKEQP